MVTLTRPELNVTLGPLQMNSPITLASGTCGYGVELAPFMNLTRLGAVFTKGLTYAPRAGNAPERIAEVASGMLNRIGLQNVGVAQFRNEKLPALVAQGVPAIANIAGATRDEYLSIVDVLEDAPGLIGLELNVSCPNVTHGGIEFGTDPHVLEDLVCAVRGRTRLPLIVKLTPGVTDFGELARAAEAAGADVLSAINTLTGLAATPRMRDGKLTAELVQGGLSGPALKPIALRCVAQARRACSLPIIGVGGISNIQDVLAFLAVGARAVQIGTASFIEPGLAERLTDELEAWVLAQGARSLDELLTEVAPC